MKTQIIFKTHHFTNTIGRSQCYDNIPKYTPQVTLKILCDTQVHNLSTPLGWPNDTWKCKHFFYAQDMQCYWTYRPRGRWCRPQLCWDHRKNCHGWCRHWHSRFPLLCLLLYYPPGPSYLILVTNEDNHAIVNTAIIPTNKVAGVEESLLDGEV